jgi:hypothetical protein
LKTVFNCLLFSPFFGFEKAVLAIPNLAHLFFAKRQAKNKKAKSFPFKKGVLSAQYCASHSVQSRALGLRQLGIDFIITFNL